MTQIKKFTSLILYVSLATAAFGANAEQRKAPYHPKQPEEPINFSCNTTDCETSVVLQSVTNAGNRLCLEYELGDNCPGIDSSVSTGGGIASVVIPDRSIGNYRFNLSPTSALTFNCRGKGKRSCSYKLLRRFNADAQGLCRF